MNFEGAAQEKNGWENDAYWSNNEIIQPTLVDNLLQK